MLRRGKCGSPDESDIWRRDQGICPLLLPPLLPSEWAVRARCDSALPQLDFAGAGAHRWPTTSQQAAVSSGESSDPRRGRRSHRGV